MIFRIMKHLVFLSLLFSATSFPNAVAQQPTPNLTPTNRQSARASPFEGGIDIYVRGADGGPIEVIALVTLVAVTGTVLRQGATMDGTYNSEELQQASTPFRCLHPVMKVLLRNFVVTLGERRPSLLTCGRSRIEKPARVPHRYYLPRRPRRSWAELWKRCVSTSQSKRGVISKWPIARLRITLR